jgi:hypothetical protein
MTAWRPAAPEDDLPTLLRPYAIAIVDSSE